MELFERIRRKFEHGVATITGRCSRYAAVGSPHCSANCTGVHSRSPPAVCTADCRTPRPLVSSWRSRQPTHPPVSMIDGEQRRYIGCCGAPAKPASSVHRWRDLLRLHKLVDQPRPIAPGSAPSSWRCGVAPSLWIRASVWVAAAASTSAPPKRRFRLAPRRGHPTPGCLPKMSASAPDSDSQSAAFK